MEVRLQGTDGRLQRSYRSVSNMQNIRRMLGMEVQAQAHGADSQGKQRHRSFADMLSVSQPLGIEAVQADGSNAHALPRNFTAMQAIRRWAGTQLMDC